MSSKKLLDVKNLTVKYHTFTAVSNVSFHVNERDFLAIIGANGSGKTTLIKALLGLLTLQEGAIEKNDNLRIGYLPQHTMTLDRFFPATVEEVVGMGLLTNKKFPKKLSKQDKQNVLDVLHMLNIKELHQKRIGALSGGQQQRVLLARALVSNPDILILDEPTSALDHSTRKQFFNIVSHLNRSHGVTILLVTHDIVSSGDYVNRVLYMDQKLIFDGSFEAFCENQDLSPFVHTHQLRRRDEEKNL